MKKASLLFAIPLIFLLTASYGYAHDWYDPACCSGQDCRPISCEDIVEKGKSLFYRGFEFYNSMIKPSKDAACHICISNEFSTEMSPVPHCIYIQQNS